MASSDREVHPKTRLGHAGNPKKVLTDKMMVDHTKLVLIPGG